MRASGSSWRVTAVMLLNLAPLPLFMVACANRPPSVPPWSQVTVLRAQQENLVGQRVRWGGDIADTTLSKQTTCFEVISHPLTREGQPRFTKQSDGRFIACAPGVYPRGLYNGEEITVVGTLQKPTARKIGDPVYPRVAVEELSFWPKQKHDTAWPAQEWPRSSEPWEPGTSGYWW